MRAASKKRRKRGVVLTTSGYERLQQAIHKAEINDLDHPRYTLERLSVRIGLDPKTIAKVLDRQIGLDKGSLARCFQAFNLDLLESDYCYPNESVQKFQADWGDAVDTSIFFGRTPELQTLSDWVLRDRCRLVAVLGLGGVGKTALSIKLAKQISEHYDWVIWRSLRNGPLITDFLSELLQVMMPKPSPAPDLASLYSQFLSTLKQQRCLLILDNWESVLRDGAGQNQAIAGLHYPHHQGYGELLRQLAEVPHQSTILVTSREKPAEIATHEGESLPVRSFPMRGLSQSAAMELLQVKGLSLHPQEGECLWQRYEGHPLGLKMVATAIADIFAGDVAAFLAEGVEVFNGLRILLKQQFQRLSGQEQQVMTWLAIYREPISLSTLRQLLLTAPTTAQLLEVLESLKRRSLCVSVPILPPHFTLQPFVRDYVTTQFTEQITAEIQSSVPPTADTPLNQFAIYLTTASEQVQAAQEQTILRPILDTLLEQGHHNLIKHLRTRLIQAQAHCPLQPGYQAGNLINLLSYLAAPLNGLNLSRLCIWQAQLHKTPLHQVNLSQSDLRGSRFATTFFAITDIYPLPRPDAALATAHFHGQILLWDHQGDIIGDFQTGNSNIWSITLNPKNESLASGGDDGAIYLWDLDLRQQQRKLQNQSSIYALTFLDDVQLLSGDASGYLKLWDLQTGQSYGWQAHDQLIWSIALNPDKTLVATGSDDHSVRIWSISGECQCILKGHQDWIRAIAFSPTEPLLATGSCDHTIRLWDVVTGQCLQVIEYHQGAIFALNFSPEGQQLISGSADQTIGIFDIDSGELLRSLKGHDSGIYALGLDHHGQLYSGGDDAQLRCWSLRTGQSLRTTTSYIDGISVIAATPDYLATASTDGALRLWQPDSGEYQTLHGHRDRIFGLAVSPDHTTLASGSCDHTVRLWSTATGECDRILTHHSANVTSVAFHPSQPILATGSWDCTLQLWNLDNGQHLQTFPDHFIQSVTFSPDGQYLAVGTFDATVKLWDWQHAKVIQRFRGHQQWAWFATFSPNGRLLASAGGDSCCRIWDVQSGRCLHILEGHTDWIMMPAFSPDGKTLATASKDGTIRLWSVQSGRCLSILAGHGSWVGAVSFSPDGQTLWSSSTALTLKQWELKTQTCVTTWQGQRLYEGLEITGTQGLSPSQRQMMWALGAISNSAYT